MSLSKVIVLISHVPRSRGTKCNYFSDKRTELVICKIFKGRKINKDFQVKLLLKGNVVKYQILSFMNEQAVTSHFEHDQGCVILLTVCSYVQSI